MDAALQGLQGDAGEKRIPGVNGADGKTSFCISNHSTTARRFTANGETPGAWIETVYRFHGVPTAAYFRDTLGRKISAIKDKGDRKRRYPENWRSPFRSRGVWKAASEVYIRSAEFIDWVARGPQEIPLWSNRRRYCSCRYSTYEHRLLTALTKWNRWSRRCLGETAFDGRIAGDPCAGG